MPSAAAAATAASLHVRHSRSFAAWGRSIPRARRELPLAPAAGAAAAGEGPSCLFVGPIDTASKEMLEALYHQARYSYYNGKPLIVDDMFDKVELKLRLYGSKSVVKYPRCSLRRQSTYADAEEDPSQVFALASVWILLLVLGTSAVVFPTIYSIGMVLTDAIKSRYFLNSGRSALDIHTMINGVLFIGMGHLIGYPVVSASVKALQGLWNNDLVALKGSCPNCGEEVFAFVKTEKSILRPHSTECHVCESALQFRAKVEVPSGPSNGLDPGVPPQMNPYTWKTTTRSTNSRNTIKKPLKRNTTVSQSAYCEVCKIDCNSPEVLNSHKQGKKHKKNLQKLQESITRKPAKAPANTVDKKQTPAADKGKAVGEQSKRKLAPATEEDLAAKKKRVLEGGAAVEGIKVCNVCNVVVNSQKVFDYHIAGQKHAAMVKKQQEASAAAS